MEQEVAELTEDADGAQKLVNDLSGDIASGGSTMANIRENLRVRRLQAEIDATQAEIDTYDLNSAAQAKQNFEDRYAQLKKREDNLHGEV
jgi:DNA repair protein RAD50